MYKNILYIHLTLNLIYKLSVYPKEIDLNEKISQENRFQLTWSNHWLQMSVPGSHRAVSCNGLPVCICVTYPSDHAWNPTWGITKSWIKWLVMSALYKLLYELNLKNLDSQAFDRSPQNITKHCVLVGNFWLPECHVISSNPLNWSNMGFNIHGQIPSLASISAATWFIRIDHGCQHQFEAAKAAHIGTISQRFCC